MRTLLGVICILFGVFGWIGQMISAIHFKLAQHLKLQEHTEHTSPLFRQMELNTARWDALILWPMIITGFLMLLRHSCRPYPALITAGIYIDTRGREAAKYMGLTKCNIKVGTAKNIWTALGCYIAMICIGSWLLGYALYTIGQQ